MMEIFNGPDKKLSLRKIIGTLLMVVGGVLLFVAEKPDDNLYSLVYSLRGLGAIIAGCFIFGILTTQAIRGMVDAAKK